MSEFLSTDFVDRNGGGDAWLVLGQVSLPPLCPLPDLLDSGDFRVEPFYPSPGWILPQFERCIPSSQIRTLGVAQRAVAGEGGVVVF